jgi:hypothetical protein
MNWNGQRPYLDHLISQRSDPNNAPVSQAAFNRQREKWVADALLTRPVYIPLSYTLPAAGQLSPIRATTPQMPYDVIITGIKTDIWPARDLNLKLNENEETMVRVGSTENLYIRSDEIMGTTVDAGGGHVGVFPLPVPVVIGQNRRLTLEVFKTDATAADIAAHIVLIGVRVFNQAISDGLLDTQERALVDKMIRARSVPKALLLETFIDFGTATYGNIVTNTYSPQNDEPLLILGCRTDLRQSQVEIGIVGEPRWTVGLTPSWAIAAETEIGHDNYQWYSKPIYLRSQGTIEIPRAINGIDTVNLTADNATGRFTFFCKTV